MNNKSKNKEKQVGKSLVNRTGDMTTKTFQNSSRRLSENVVEERFMTYTSSYSSVRVTKSEHSKSGVAGGAPILNKSVSLFENQLNKSPLFSTDAKPFNLTNSTPINGGYQSPFSRKLSPYSSDARPFSAILQPSSSTQRNNLIQSASVSQNLPKYGSSLAEPLLYPSASTPSLPASTEVRIDPRIPTYDTNGKKRGKVLVINNIKFLQQKQERKGAEMDEKSVKNLFKDMGFDVDTFRDLKKNAMVEKVNKFSKDSTLKKVDMSIVVMMSHGSNVNDDGKVIHGGFTQIYGIDDVGLSIDDVLDKFSAENCPAMAGKPKIFVFQCCRGEREEITLHTDALPMNRKIVKKHADMLIAYSTLPGFFSIRDTSQGSWYIQGICDVFKKHAKQLDVEALLKIVDDQLSRKHPTYQQTSSYECRGFKRCFLNPK